MTTATAVIADDHALIRQGLRQMLAGHGLTVVAEASDGLEAIALVRQHEPTLLTLDIAMPYARGIEVFGEVRRWSPGTKVMVFSGLTSTGLIGQLDAAGAEGLFLKRDPLDDFSEAIPRVLAGQAARSRGVREILDAAVDRVEITAREQQVLSLVVRGLPNRAVAERLGISVKTVDNHRTNLMRKLGAHSVAELVAYALREGLLDPSRES